MLRPDGNLVLVGRTSDMYIRGGYNVYPLEVENVLAEHPAVDRAAVVGLPAPVIGEIGVAFVTVAPGAAAPTLAELRAWVADRLADYKAPDRLEVVDALPLTAMMKIDKAALLAHAERTTEQDELMAHERELPQVEDETRPYWEAAKQGKLLVKRCNACGEVHHYPRPFCPTCWSEDVEWLEASGRGTLYTYSVVFRNDLAPFSEWGTYVPAIVELDEGPRLMTNIVDVPTRVADRRDAGAGEFPRPHRRMGGAGVRSRLTLIGRSRAVSCDLTHPSSRQTAEQTAEGAPP